MARKVGLEARPRAKIPENSVKLGTIPKLDQKFLLRYGVSGLGEFANEWWDDI